METVQETRPEFDAELEQREGASVQAGCYLLELSPDWMVRRASENVHELLGESHVALIDEPLGRFVHAQALHDLRNLFSRLSPAWVSASSTRCEWTSPPIRSRLRCMRSG